MAEYARSHMGVAVETGTLEELRPSKQYDVVSLIQVIAHFVDPRRALQVASAMTKPGGYWLIETWNKDSWIARIFDSLWHEYSPPCVLHWFSPETLRQFVREFGFEEVGKGRPVKWIRPSYAKTIARSDLGQTAIGKLIDAVTGFVPERLPLPYLSDDLFWVLYRKRQQRYHND